MKTKTIVLASALTIAAVGVAGATAFHQAAEARPFMASHMVDHGGDFLQWRIERFMDRLELDDAQRAQVTEVLRSHRPRVDAIRNEMRSNVDRMIEITPDDAGYEQAVAETKETTTRLAAELVDVTSRLRGDLYAILHPEQKQELAEIKAQMRERIADMRTRVDARRDRLYEEGF